VRARPAYDVLINAGLPPQAFAHARVVTASLDQLKVADAASTYMTAGDAASE
jgi:hypothetical protein